MEHRITALATVGMGLLLGVACTAPEIEPAGIRVDDAELCRLDDTLYAVYSVGSCTPVLAVSCTILAGEPPTVTVEVEVDGTPYDCTPTNVVRDIECGPLPTGPFSFRGIEQASLPICLAT